MKQGKHQKRWRQRWRKVVHGGPTRMLKPRSAPTPRKAETPLDESPSLPVPSDDNNGVLRFDRASRLPTALAEASEYEDGQRSWMPGSLVMTISLLAIVFIVIITWFISQMPDK
jgi:hypothetical protein